MQQGAEREAAEAKAALAQEMAAGEEGESVAAGLLLEVEHGGQLSVGSYQ
jgi:hypothetical protein